MSLHGCAIFTNLCMRTPVNPKNKHPRPSFLKPQCVLDADKSKGHVKKKRRKKCPKTSPSPLLDKDSDSFSTLLQFYDSIPDYNDIGHLSELEFNIRLDTLRKKQLELGFRTLCLTDDVGQAVELEANRPERPVRKGSAKSVRISSAESMHSPVQFLDEREDNTSKYFRKTLRPTTMPSSPDRYSSKSQLTVPEPFAMTKRDECKQSLENLTALVTPLEGRRSPLHNRDKPFKANPVPVTSKFPMYQEILKDQEHKSQLAKLDAAIELQSQMKPFSFDLRPPTRNRHCLTRSFSSPNLLTPASLEDQKPAFKATPYPKNLFSNYFYNKKCEENYIRDLRKTIRAEEMAKMAKLPKSMAKREESLASISNKPTKKRRKKRNKEPVAIKTPSSDYITTCQHPFELQTDKRARNSKPCNHSVSSPTTESSRTRPQTTSSNSYYSSMPDIPRSNLASTFRRESSRRKIEKLTTKQRLLDEMPKLANYKRPKWHVEKMASWKALSYDPTHSENEATLLSIRKAEQRMRQEQYDIEMEIMRQRVKAAPLLLEGATTYGRRPAHKCYSETPTDDGRKSKRSGSSKLSDYSKTVISGEEPFVHELDSVDRNFL